MHNELAKSCTMKLLKVVQYAENARRIIKSYWWVLEKDIIEIDGVKRDTLLFIHCLFVQHLTLLQQN